MFTATDCRIRAADDVRSAGASRLANCRVRFEMSAKMWTERADLLDSLGRTTTARRASHRGETDA